jgi:hypothetical protein
MRYEREKRNGNFGDLLLGEKPWSRRKFSTSKLSNKSSWKAWVLRVAKAF